MPAPLGDAAAGLIKQEAGGRRSNRGEPRLDSSSGPAVRQPCYPLHHHAAQHVSSSDFTC